VTTDNGGGKLQSGASGSGQLMSIAEMGGKNFFRAEILARAFVGQPQTAVRRSRTRGFFGDQREFHATVVVSLGLTG
jgi:hypothetical protein